MSENKKGPGSSLANSQGTNKSSNKLYHERNEESKMNISTAVSVLKNNLERYDEQMKMHGIMGGDLLGENPTISAMRKAVEILENIKIVYQKTVIPNELYRDGNIEHIKKGSAIGMAEEYLYHKTAQVNPIASYLYGTDVHGHPINGNVLIIGTKEGLDGMEFCGMNEEQAVELRERLITIRQHLE